MSSDISIKVENLSKCYQIYDQPRDLPTLVKFVHDHASKVADLRTEKKGEDGEL